MVKLEGGRNDLVDRIRSDEFFLPIRDQVEDILHPKNFIGRSEEQVELFLEEELLPAVEPYKKYFDQEAVVNV